MTHRFLVYPLLFIVLLQLGPMLRRDVRWQAMQIGQLIAILLLATLALALPDGRGWALGAWTLFGLVIGLPRLLLGLAERLQQQAAWRGAARCHRLAGGLLLGQAGRLHRAYAAALYHLAAGDSAGAEQLLDELAARPLPKAARGTVTIWRLSLLGQQRAWDRVVAGFEAAEEWGTLWAMTQARLLVANAYGETGQFERALRSLLFATLSPVAVRLGIRLHLAQVRLAALAGDAPGLERLLRARELPRRGLPRFAAYWRGRCALVCRQPGEAVRQLTRAHALTHARESLWRQAINDCLQRAETAATPWPLAEESRGGSPGGSPYRSSAGEPLEAPPPPDPVLPAQTEQYARGMAAVQSAEKQGAAWRALMQVGRPAGVTLWLLTALAIVFAVECFLPTARDEQFVLWAANSPATLHQEQLWRLFTALFLHANLLHLFMNGLGMWVFGSAIEQAAGRWRLLLIFLLGGAAGNLLSATMDRHEIAVGASSGVFALVAAFGVAVWRLEKHPYGSLRRRLLLVLALMVSADLTIGWLEPQIDNLAHVGGFFAGLLLATLLGWRRPVTTR